MRKGLAIYGGWSLFQTYGRVGVYLAPTHREALPPLLSVGRPQAQLLTHFETMEKK